MKKTKSLFPLLTFAFIFACVMSCDEHEEKLSAKNEVVSTSIPAGRTTSGVDGTVGDPISLATAKKWTANYRENAPDETLGHYFGFEIIQQILNQENCVGIRIYYAINDDGEKQLLLVGVDAEGEDLLPVSGGRTDGDGDIIADASLPCPDYCAGNGL